eukprot:g281.t1
MSNAVQQLVETLVRVVARAFYPDEVVVVVDTLVREKYLRDDLLGPRMNLKTRQVRKVLQLLLLDDLVMEPELVSLHVHDSEGSGKLVTLNKKYWYIDYARFVDVLQLRLKLMEKKLQTTEERETEQQRFRCEACGREWTHLECMSAITAGGAFRCRDSGCGSMDLREVSSGEALSTAQDLLRRLKQQLRGEEGCRPGITELLKSLKGEAISHNLPSENIKHGAGGNQFAVGTAGLVSGGSGAARGAAGADGAYRVDESELLFGRNMMGQNVSVALDLDGGGGGAGGGGAAGAAEGGAGGGGDGAVSGGAQAGTPGAALDNEQAFREQYAAAMREAVAKQQAEQQAAAAAATAAAAASAPAPPPVYAAAGGGDDDDDDDDDDDEWDEA